MESHSLPGRRASAVSMAVNGGLALIKLVTGLAGQSYALVADAFESLSDIVSSFLVWSGLVIASRPADENHPYGHGKAEPLAALAVAGMLVTAAAAIAVQAVREIGTPHTVPAWYTLPVLLIIIVIKEAMYRYESRVAQQVGSTAVHADAWHHRSDALTSVAAAVGITIALAAGPAYAAADDWAALLVCAVIVFNGARFAQAAIRELMDTVPDTAILDVIQRDALEVEGAQFVEKLFVRKMGTQLYVDMHLEVDPELSVRRAHDIAHRVKGTIMAQRPQIADVLIHIEPHITRAP